MEITTRLPAEKERITNFYESCEKRHKFVEGIKDHAEKHLRKAKHDLSRAIREFEDKCWDWTIIKAYYAVFHVGNFLLLKNKGFFCKDHSCLLIALEHHELISKELYKELSDIHEKLSGIFGFDLTFQLRKLGQYDVYEWEKITQDDARLIILIAKKFVQFAENA